jgi:septal ring-binding cell division protein DamX
MYLAGQVLLGALIVALFLVVWPVGRTNPDPEPSPSASSTAPEGGVESGSDHQLPGTMQAPISEVATGTETRTTPRSPQGPDAKDPGAGAPSQTLAPRGIAAAAAGEEEKPATPEKPKGQNPAESASPPEPVVDEKPSASSQGEAAAMAPIHGETASESNRLAPAASEQPDRSQLLQERGDGQATAKAEAGALADDEALASEPEDGATVLKEERFAIQLVSYNSESRVAAFAEEFGVASEARYTRSQSRGQDLFSVVLGAYRSNSEAAIALESLSPRLRELGPWVRSLPAGTRLMPASAAASDE